MPSKAALRATMKQTLVGLSPETRKSAADALALCIDEFPAPVGLYASFGDELSTDGLDSELRRRNICRAVPRFNTGEIKFFSLPTQTLARELPLDEYGIPTPPLSFLETSVATVLVPGLAFSLSGARLGRGKGLYDQYLRRHPTIAAIVGVFYDAQEVLHCPMDSRDVFLPKIFTPKHGIRTMPASGSIAN